jgi:hypothetical protein
LVAAALYVAVNNLEPNRRHASALKILIVTHLGRVHDGTGDSGFAMASTRLSR